LYKIFRRKIWFRIRYVFKCFSIGIWWQKISISRRFYKLRLRPLQKYV